jgi:hypothetical protein
MKGVMLSHFNLIANTLQYRASVPSLHNGSQREVFFAPCKFTLRSFIFDMGANAAAFQTVTSMALERS